MNLPEISSYEDQAVDAVASVLNRAKEQLGLRLTLKQLARTRSDLAAQHKISLATIRSPLAISGEKFIADTIEKKWRLTTSLKYILRYLESSQDVCAHYYYYEAVFSQPTAAYPIPQATVSVFFRLENKLLDLSEGKGIPMLFFRIEGHTTDHDVRFVFLTVDWIMAEIKMKINFFKRLEEIKLF